MFSKGTMISRKILYVNIKNFGALTFLLFVHRIFILLLELMAIASSSPFFLQCAHNGVNFFASLLDISLSVLCFAMNGH